MSIINPQQLPQIRWQNQNVITTELLAQCYGAQEKQIRQNYANNKSRFIEGKHFFKLEGEALKSFKQASKSGAVNPLGEWFNQSGLDEVFGKVDKIDSATISPFAPLIMLWTDKGAARHSKILDTDKAWDVFDQLEETYFHPERRIAPTTQTHQPQHFAALQAELLKANPRLQDVLNLTRLGYSQARIGEMLGLGPTAIYTAIKRLRQCGFVVCADNSRLLNQGGAA